MKEYFYDFAGWNESLFHNIHNLPKSEFTVFLTKLLAFTGSSTVVFATIGICFILSVYFAKINKKSNFEIFSLLLIASLGSTSVVVISKFLFLMPRPFVILENIQPLLEVPAYKHYHSMPSGHTIFTMVMGVCFFNILKNPTLKLAVFVYVVAMAISRVYAGIHFPADVIWGSVFGIIVGFLALPINIFFVENFYSILRNKLSKN